MGEGMLDEIYRPLMDAPSVKLPYCAVCGRSAPLNDHHIVWRGWGNLLDGRGRKLPKPTVTLCGAGSVRFGVDAAGNRVEFCHGKCHANKIHFRNDRGRLEYIELDVPTKYGRALLMEGWRDLDTEERPWI